MRANPIYLVGNNVMKCFLTTMCTAARNNMGAFGVYEKIIQTMVEVEPLASMHYLYYIVSSRNAHSHQMSFLIQF